MFTASPSNTSEVRRGAMHSSQSFCRLCAKPCELSSLLHIFSDNKIGTVSLDALLKRYLPFPVSVNDSLSHYICKLCCGYVLRWHRFLTLCVKAQIQLKNVEQSSSMLPHQEKLELDVPVGESMQGSKYLVPKLGSVNSRAADQLKLSSSAKKRKSNYCIARWCNNSNDMGVPFFRVPKDHNRALQWLSAADRMDLASKDAAYLYRCYLCATHFSKDMFVNETGKALSRNAVPTVFMKPAYAKKIEEAISNSNIYPKALQGIRLKNILPKSVQQTHGISVQGPLPVPRIQESYTHILGMVPEPQQKPLQEVFFVRDPVSSHQNVHIISMSPLRNDVPETIQILEVQNAKDIATEPPQVLNIVTDSESGGVYQDSAKDVCTKTEHTDNIFVSEFIKADKIHDGNCKDIDMNQMESRSRCSLSQGALMDFSPGDANMTMLNLNEKPSNIIEKTAILENHVEEDLGLHELQSEDALAMPAFSSETPSFVNQDGMGFQSKELTKDSSSHCLGNIVGSQDFLLMHSSSTHIEEVHDHDHGFAQDKNLNLCATMIPESVAGTTAAYGERCDSMMAEASVRAIECTSPSHGQIIEGLMDLDHFLDSG